MKINTLALLLFFAISLVAQTPSEFIHIDQFGYASNSAKVAVISNPKQGYNSSMGYAPSTTMEVRNANSNAIIFSGTPSMWNNGNTHDQSGDQGWWFDFSTISTPGTYYLIDPNTGERTGDFEINDNPYPEVLKAAGRMFYYNRCNATKEATHAGVWSDGMNFMNPLQDGNCRYIYDRFNADLEKELSGGWFDAGDYNKYVTFTHSTLHNLLSAYEENPNAFPDNWNIPESGNGLPDIIDEIKWELDWMQKMVNPDGSVHIKMGSQNFNENSASPPSANFDQRFYGPTCTSASVAVASVFSHAAKVLEQFPELQNYANGLRQTAISCYNYAIPYVDNNSLQTDCDDGSIIAGDADQDVQSQLNNLFTAAVYLYEATAEPTYNNRILALVNNLEQLVNNFWGPYLMPLNDALLLYADLSNADAAVADAIRSSFSTDIQNNGNGYFGFSESDLYRAYIPDWSYHWGSSQPKATYGVLNKAVLKADLAAGNTAAFEQYIDEAIHYFHGVNPQGLVYLSNMYELGAERGINEIYHAWFAHGTEYDNTQTSPFGPPPGYVTGGANASFSVTDLSPPANQPLQKSYLDFNDSWPLNSWEISEPAIYYQAAYIRLLANRVGSDLITSTTNTSLYESLIKTFPNPVIDQLQIVSKLPIEQIQLFSVDGRLIWQAETPDNTVDMSALQSGVYLLKVNGSQVKKIIKR